MINVFFLDFFLFLIFLTKISNEFYQLDKEISLNIEKNKTYYINTSINDIKENEPITFNIKGELDAKFFYILYENDTKIKDNINEYSFVEGILAESDNSNRFLSVFQTNGKFTNLLLKLEILLNISKSINIIKIITTTFKPYKNINISFTPKDYKFFFFGLDIYLKKYDIFMYLSNIIKCKITYYEININDNSSISLIKKNASYLLAHEETKIKYIYIKANENESFNFYINFFEKNQFSFIKDYNILNNIELYSSSQTQSEKYYLFDFTENGSDFEQYIFTKKKNANFESYYKFVNNSNDLYEIFNDINNINDTKLENSILRNINQNNFLVIYFKSNNSPVIFDLINMKENNILKYGKVSYIIVSEGQEKIIPVKENISNINITFEYIGPDLEKEESLKISINDYNYNITNETKIQKVSNEISNGTGDYIFKSYSKKTCVIKVKFGTIVNKENLNFDVKKEIHIQNEHIFINSKNLQGDYHYLILVKEVSYKMFYEDDDIFCEDDYLKPQSSTIKNYIELKQNTKIFGEYNLIIDLKKMGNHSSYNVIKVKKGKDLKINETSELEPFTEYILPKNGIEKDISIQIFDDFNYDSNIKIDKYFFKINQYNKFQLYRIEETDIFKILNINKKLSIIINNINDIEFYNIELSKKKIFNVNVDYCKERITFYLEPLLINKNIKYTFHYSNKLFLINKETNQLIEAFKNFNKTEIKLNLDFKVIAIDLETGFLKTYEGLKYEFIEIKSKKWVIILIICLLVFILLVIVIYNLIMEKKVNKNSSYIEETLYNDNR